MQDEQPDEPLLVKFFSLTWPMKNKSVSRGLLGPEIPANDGSCRGRPNRRLRSERTLTVSSRRFEDRFLAPPERRSKVEFCARAYVGAESRDADIIHPAERRFRWHPE
jgi:hypothetical protein